VRPQVLNKALPSHGWPWAGTKHAPRVPWDLSSRCLQESVPPQSWQFRLQPTGHGCVAINANDAIILAEVFAKTTQATPKAVIDVCKKRLREWDKE
jgi:hypothetical protein